MRSANVLQLTGQTVDPACSGTSWRSIPVPDKVNSFDSGDSRADRILNTARYRFSRTISTNRNQWIARADYELDSKNRFEFVYS